jgi:hypothetical protein
LATTKAFELAQLSALTTVDASGNVTTNTSQIANASGDLILDSAADIVLNADGADIILADDTVDFGRFKRDNGHLVIKSETIDKSVIIKGTTTSNAVVTALTFDMANSGRATFSENVVIQGDLTVEGSQVTLNTTALDVEDKNITLNYHASNDTSASADGAGITIQDAVNATTDATILWNTSSSRFDFSHKVNVAGDVSATNYYGQDFYVLNSAANGWHKWAERDNDKVDLDVFNINSASLSAGYSSTLKGYFYESTVDQNGSGKPSSVLGLASHIDSRGEGPSIDFNAVWNGNLAYHQDNWDEGWTVGRIAGIYDSAGLDTGALAFYTQTSGSADGADSSSLTEKVRITSSGAVGIGTDTPDALLHLKSTVNSAGPSIIFENTNNAQAMNIDYYNNAGSIQSRIQYAEGPASWNFIPNTSNSNSALYIAYDGKVGVNNADPVSTLDVRSTNSVGSVFRKDFNGSVANTFSKVAATLWGQDHDEADDGDGTSQYGPMLGFGARIDDGDPNSGDVRAGIAYSYNGDLTLHAKAGVSVADGSYERMRIDGVSGSVGIDHDAPVKKLSVNVGADQDGIFLYSNKTQIASLERFTIGGVVQTSLNGNAGRNIHIGGAINTDIILGYAGGKVSIGTGTTPEHKLEVEGAVATSDVRHSVRPALLLDFVNGKRLDPRIYFARSSTGVYYDGKTEVLADQNLVPDSTTWSNWSKTGYNFTSNATTAPDGTTTAYRFSPISSAAGTSVAIGSNISKTTDAYTYTVYAKMDSSDYPAIALYWNSSGSAHVRFDIQNGSTISTNNGNGTISGTIESAGNGWYRCSTTYSGATSTSATIYLLDSTGSSDWSLDNSPDGVKGAYLWGPQIEIRSSATQYVATTSKPIERYQPKLMTKRVNEPRFDHDPVTGKSKGLLIEKTKTNSIIWSEDFSNWSLNGLAQVRTNRAIAPDGTKTADELYILGQNTNYQNRASFDSQVQSAGANTYTFSCYLKSSGLQYAALTIFDGTAYRARADFDLINGTIASDVDGNNLIEDVGNGWYRCMVTGTTTAVMPVGNRASGVWPRYGTGDSGPEIGDATKVGAGILAWGAQLDTSPYATSYMPTSGSTTTRTPDICNLDGSNFSDIYTYSDSSVFAEWSKKYNLRYNNESGSAFKFGDGGGGYVDMIQSAEGALTSYIGGRIYYDSTFQAGAGSQTYPSDLSINIREAMAWKDGELAWTSSLSSLSTSSPAVIPKRELNTLHIGRGWGTTAFIDGYIRKLSYYPARLSNTELTELVEE